MTKCVPIFSLLCTATITLLLSVTAIPKSEIRSGSCRTKSKIRTSGFVEIEDSKARVDSLAILAEKYFSELPRNTESVSKAYQVMQKVLGEDQPGKADQVEHTLRATWFAIWLSYHATDKDTVVRRAEDAIELASKAVEITPNRVEGYYYRAIATGLHAEHNPASARSAMNKMRSDASKAISIDPGFDRGGPHRLLGSLYLRAPGPPTGIGSKKRAEIHLRQALELAPDFPENLLLLAEALETLDKKAEARELARRVLTSESPAGDLIEKPELIQRANEVIRKTEPSAPK